VDLCGDHLPMWSISYVTLFRLGLVSDGGNKPISNRAPRTIGSSASKLLKYLDGSHHDAKLTDHERKVVRLWIDGSANWAGTYACLGATQLAERKGFDMPGFRPNKFYIREMQRFGFLPQDLGPNDPVDPYATDQAYWQSFWWQPHHEGAE
jgi:hypothetical protein